MSSTAVFSLWIINKAGGLIYQRNYSDGLSALSANEYLVLAGTFHGIHAITGRIGPKLHGAPKGGVEVIEAESFKMCCLQSATGTKFVLLTTPSHPNPHAILKKVYEAYAEQMKDPFYKSEMPIVRVDSFDEKIKAIVSGYTEVKK